MDWKDKRKLVEKEIRIHVVPLLRHKGFTGNYPLFRRIHDEATDVLEFQFSQWGPQLHVAIATEAPLVDEAYPAPEPVVHSRYGAPTRLGDSPFDVERDESKSIVDKIISSLPGGEIWWKEQA